MTKLEDTRRAKDFSLQFVLDALVAHRLRREAKVLGAITGSPQPIEALLLRAYDDVPPALHGVAARSLLAHLLKLRDEGRAQEQGEGWRIG